MFANQNMTPEEIKAHNQGIARAFGNAIKSFFIGIGIFIGIVFGGMVVVAIVMVATGHGPPGPTVTQQINAQVDAEAAKEIVVDGSGMPFPTIKAGQVIHVQEGFINSDESDPQGVATTYLQSMIVGNQDGAARMKTYHGYRHYGETGEQSPPACSVESQSRIDIKDVGGFKIPLEPIDCVLAGGTHIYVTSWVWQIEN